MTFGREFRQNQRIGEANRIAARANRQSEKLEDTLDELEGRIEKLSMLCQAMWEVLQTKAKFPDTLLAAKLEEIQARNVGPNGKKVFHCASCNRALNKNHLNKCMYCGQEQPPRSIFEMM
ncbi:MAG: hypothetical protein F6K42_07000 [Leptolyngbya sp. SIO1D8]|nr:hypothetical protein [Leptolyngbya sp. SIO1D8]